MNTFIVSVDGDLQIMVLLDISADTDFSDIVGEVIADADTDDPLIALKNPARIALTEVLEGGLIRLSKMRSMGATNGN